MDGGAEGKDGRMGRRPDKWTEWQMNGWAGGRTDELMDGQRMDGKTDGWTERRMDAWIDEPTDGKRTDRTDR